MGSHRRFGHLQSKEAWMRQKRLLFLNRRTLVDDGAHCEWVPRHSGVLGVHVVQRTRRCCARIRVDRHQATRLERRSDELCAKKTLSRRPPRPYHRTHHGRHAERLASLGCSVSKHRELGLL